MAKYRITADGAVNLYGIMPHSNETGWYFIGWVGDTYLHRYLKEHIEPLSAKDVATINRMEKGSMRALRTCLRWIEA